MKRQKTDDSMKKSYLYYGTAHSTASTFKKECMRWEKKVKKNEWFLCYGDFWFHFYRKTSFSFPSCHAMPHHIIHLSFSFVLSCEFPHPHALFSPHYKYHAKCKQAVKYVGVKWCNERLLPSYSFIHSFIHLFSCKETKK